MQTVHKDVFTSPAHDWFLHNLDEIRSRATACLCRLRPEAREEAVAEVMAAVFCAAVRAARRGTLCRVTPFHAVVFATKQFRLGRRVAGTSSTDVTADATAAKRRVRLVSLESADPKGEGGVSVTIAETLADRRIHEMPFDRTRQNLDYPYILRVERVGAKARKLFSLLSGVRGTGCGNRIAQALKVSPGRVSQLKALLARALASRGYAPT